MWFKFSCVSKENGPLPTFRRVSIFIKKLNISALISLAVTERIQYVDPVFAWQHVGQTTAHISERQSPFFWQHLRFMSHFPWLLLTEFYVCIYIYIYIYLFIYISSFRVITRRTDYCRRFGESIYIHNTV